MENGHRTEGTIESETAPENDANDRMIEEHNNRLDIMFLATQTLNHTLEPEESGNREHHHLEPKWLRRWWWWWGREEEVRGGRGGGGVWVVVVVRTLCSTCVSLHTRRRCMHLIRVAGHLGVRLPATPPPLPRPNGGGHPLPF